MTIYQTIANFGPKLIGKSKMLKFGFNFSPMYRRSTGKILEVSEDICRVRMTIPISYKNRNYVGSIFGGSMFSAVDPIPMVQLINILENEFVVWDKSAEIFFKAPAKEDLYATFEYSCDELEEIKQYVTQHDEMEIIKTTNLTNREGDRTYCVVKKKIYISTKAHYKKKLLARQNKKSPQ